VLNEFEKYVVITVYLWLLFALFSLHKQLVQGHGVSIWQQGFAIVNAVIFGKVILIGQALEVGKGLERRALVWVVLGKSLIFAILLLAFHIAEEAIRGWFRGQPLSDSFADFGGSLPGLVAYAAIFFVALSPFFAFQETARVLGGGALWNLFFRGGEERFGSSKIRPCPHKIVRSCRTEIKDRGLLWYAGGCATLAAVTAARRTRRIGVRLFCDRFKAEAFSVREALEIFPHIHVHGQQPLQVNG
jgi:voltage-gated potassium channel Kch